MGLALVPDESVDPTVLDIEWRVTGEANRQSATAEFSYDELVAYTWSVMILCPGDVILTGTLGGVGIVSDPPNLLEPGGVVKAEIEVICTLTHHVMEVPPVAEPDIASVVGESIPPFFVSH